MKTRPVELVTELSVSCEVETKTVNPLLEPLGAEAIKLLDVGSLDCCSVVLVDCVAGRPVEILTEFELGTIEDDTTACDWLCSAVVEPW